MFSEDGRAVSGDYDSESNGPFQRKEISVEERIEDPQGTFGPMLEYYGLEDVRVAAALTPDHMSNAMSVDGVEPDDIAEILPHIQYFQVTTRQGNLGIFIAAAPGIDLTETGLTLKELLPEEPDLPDNLAVMPLGEEGLMFRFIQKLERRQRDADSAQGSAVRRPPTF